MKERCCTCGESHDATSMRDLSGENQVYMCTSCAQEYVDEGYECQCTSCRAEGTMPDTSCDNCGEPIHKACATKGGEHEFTSTGGNNPYAQAYTTSTAGLHFCGEGCDEMCAEMAL